MGRGKRAAACAWVWAWLAASCLGAELIVRTDGTTLWARSTPREQGAALLYVDDATGVEVSLEKGHVDAVVPSAPRGQTCSEEEVRRVLETIGALERRRPKLKRQLNLLRQEWEALGKTSEPGIAEEISGLLTRYNANPADTPTFKEVSLALGMIQFKDMRGEHTARITGALAEIQQRYAATNMALLAALAADTNLALAAFRQASRIAGDLSAAKLGEAEKGRVNGWIAACRTNAWNYNTRRTRSSFNAAKTVSAYLDAMAACHVLKNEVATDESQKGAVDVFVRGMQSALRTTAPDVSCEWNDYPLSGADRELLRRNSRRSSLIRVGSVELDEQCVVLPLQAVPDVGRGVSPECPLRLVFNRAQPPERQYAMVLMLFGEENRTWVCPNELGGLRVKDGHTDVAWKPQVRDLDPAFPVQRQDDGQAYLVAWLAYSDAPPGNGERDWRAASLAIPLRLRP